MLQEVNKTEHSQAGTLLSVNHRLLNNNKLIMLLLSKTILLLVEEDYKITKTKLLVKKLTDSLITLDNGLKTQLIPSEIGSIMELKLLEILLEILPITLTTLSVMLLKELLVLSMTQLTQSQMLLMPSETFSKVLVKILLTQPKEHGTQPKTLLKEHGTRLRISLLISLVESLEFQF